MDTNKVGNLFKYLKRTNPLQKIISKVFNAYNVLIPNNARIFKPLQIQDT